MRWLFEEIQFEFSQLHFNLKHPRFFSCSIQQAEMAAAKDALASRKYCFFFATKEPFSIRGDPGEVSWFRLTCKPATLHFFARFISSRFN